MRSRFHVATLALIGSLLLGACSHHFGPGIADLPASQGWQPLPIGSLGAGRGAGSPLDGVLPA